MFIIASLVYFILVKFKMQYITIFNDYFDIDRMGTSRIESLKSLSSRGSG